MKLEIITRKVSGWKVKAEKRKIKRDKSEKILNWIVSQKHMSNFELSMAEKLEIVREGTPYSKSDILRCLSLGKRKDVLIGLQKIYKFKYI